MSKPYFTRQTAIVTGAGSGIGLALSRALASAGARVVCADIDGVAAERAAGSLEGARPLTLDVTEAAAVQAAVDGVVDEHGRLDLMFNNAGISLGGETEELTLEHWNSIIDVNIRGVVHGVAAAYPLMVRQGSGHIVNTASMGGLMAAGLLTSYVMTKHAVVGLSLALRSEAAAKGVGVTAVCPSAVDTPILDKGAIGRFHGRDYFLKGQGVRHPHDPDRLAQEVLEAVRRNRALLVTPRTARATWLVGRLAPRTTQRMSIRFVATQRELQAARAALVEVDHRPGALASLRPKL
jgi:NAD(P)-dependent dehydrogenase (short-subunit alcohol dehydrogenase family)